MPENPPSRALSVDAVDHLTWQELRHSILGILGWATLAFVAFRIAYLWSPARPLIVVYLFSLAQLARQKRWRLAFYSGLLVGFAVGVKQLCFFYTLFSWGAVGLWLIFGFWIGLFVALARLALRRFGPVWGLLTFPFLWTGLEYFRSELYYLRFAWLTPGFAFADPSWGLGFRLLGSYGAGFLMMGLVVAVMAFRRLRTRAVALVVVVAVLTVLPTFSTGPGKPARASRVEVAGIQMEFPTENEVMIRLRELLRRHPEAELVVLSEYTFDGPIPQQVRDWCARNERYLIAGGKEPLSKGCFYNTAYVIDPRGQVVFKQVKAVPIQFMKDGLAARTQHVWNSPWGKIGICICYDLGYTRVTDTLVEQGAEALIVPTMDVIDWGKPQHKLHARVAPVRAAEYALPVFRVASSGISQHVDRSGHVLASAAAGADGAFITGVLELRGPGSLPIDRWLAPFCVVVCGVMAVFFGVNEICRFRWASLLAKKPQG